MGTIHKMVDVKTVKICSICEQETCVGHYGLRRGCEPRQREVTVRDYKAMEEKRLGA